jgi:hypothetical protein
MQNFMTKIKFNVNQFEDIRIQITIVYIVDASVGLSTIML